MRPVLNRTGADRPCDTLQAVLFDMDGLLVDTEPLWFQVESSVMARLGGEWTPADQRALIGGSLHRSVSYLIDRASDAGSGASHDEVASWLVDGMAELIGSRDVAPLPGAVELLGEIRAAGLPHALVTSSERVIVDAVLRALARYDMAFDVIVSGADVRNPKPHPEPYQLAATLVGADPRCCVALEDSPNGVASAQAAGCVTVAVPGLVPIADQPGRLIVSSLADIDLATLRAMVLGVFLDEGAAGQPQADDRHADRHRDTLDHDRIEVVASERVTHRVDDVSEGRHLRDRAQPVRAQRHRQHDA
jgi:HAD superfamily hydrolase (TIGR01509 family)